MGQRSGLEPEGTEATPVGTLVTLTPTTCSGRVPVGVVTRLPCNQGPNRCKSDLKPGRGGDISSTVTRAPGLTIHPQGRRFCPGVLRSQPLPLGLRVETYFTPPRTGLPEAPGQDGVYGRVVVGRPTPLVGDVPDTPGSRSGCRRPFG